jgi:biotin operon repressor
MAASIEISTTTIEKNIKKLKEKGILERAGFTKGHWEIK